MEINRKIITLVSQAHNHTSHTSGTAFAASMLKGLLADVIDNGNGEVVTDVFMGSYLKTIFDSFTAGQTKYWDAPTKTLTDAINVYDSGGFGRVIVHYHRYIQTSNESTGRVLGLNLDLLKLAYLQQPFIQTDLSISGDYDARAVVGQATVECRNGDIAFYADGYIKDPTLQ